MIRVLVGELRGGEDALVGDEYHYVARVRRAAVGDAIVVFDGAGRQATARIAAITGDRATIVVGAIVDVPQAGPHVTAIVPLIKGDRLDLCIEKLVEVGVDRVLLYRADRAVVKLDGERATARVTRLAAVAQAAARQAGRAQTPAIGDLRSLAENLASVEDCDRRWIALPGGEAADRGGTRIAILTGPEGGFTASEIDAAIGAGFEPIVLGPYVMRAETAPIVGVALAKSGSSTI